MAKENLKNTIELSLFDSDYKNRLVAILPFLEKNTVAFLENEVQRGDSILIQESITNQWEFFAKVLKEFRSNNLEIKQEFWKNFHEKKDYLNDEDKYFFLGLVLDLKLFFLQKNSIFTQDEYLQLLEFEVDLFEFLPMDEVEILLQNNFIFLANHIPVLKSVQASAYDNDWILDDKFEKSFSEALQKNKEVLQSKTIGEWLKSFIDFSSIPVSKRGSFHVSDFQIKNKEVLNLNDGEKNILIEAIKVFIWSLKPEINIKEIKGFKIEREKTKTENYNKIISQLISASQVGNSEVVENKVPPIVPKPNMITKQLDIDKKLEDLGNRVKSKSVK